MPAGIVAKLEQILGRKRGKKTRIKRALTIFICRVPVYKGRLTTFIKGFHLTGCDKDQTRTGSFDFYCEKKRVFHCYLHVKSGESRLILLIILQNFGFVLANLIIMMLFFEQFP